MAYVMHGQQSRGGGGGRSPLPSLEQLRARILQERATASLNRSASTSAASAAARQYAMDKLLGGSFREGAVSPVSDTAEEEDEEQRRSASLKVDRRSLRRSRTIGGLSASAEAHRKAAFAQALDEGVPADLRNARRSSRRFAHAPPGRADALPSSEASMANTAPDTSATATASAPAPAPNGEVSQRQIARTQMLRKLSTRRGAKSPANALEESAVKADPEMAAEQTQTTSPNGQHALTEASISQLQAMARTGAASANAQSSPTPPEAIPFPTSAGVQRDHPQTPGSPLNQPSPAMQGSLLAVPTGRLTRSSSLHSSVTSDYERDRRRVSELARLEGEAAFEYERLLEMGYTTDDAYERVASRSSARSVSVVEYDAPPERLPSDWGSISSPYPLETPPLVSPARMLVQQNAAAHIIESPGNRVPVNVSPPINVSLPNTTVVQQNEWAIKRSSEASIPLGFDSGSASMSFPESVVAGSSMSFSSDPRESGLQETLAKASMADTSNTSTSSNTLGNTSFGDALSNSSFADTSARAIRVGTSADASLTGSTANISFADTSDKAIPAGMPPTIKEVGVAVTRGPSTSRPFPSLTARMQHDRNASITSSIALQQPDDLSLALDPGLANHAPSVLKGPASLTPATAAVLHRYSRMLTAPTLSHSLPSIPGLSLQQLDDPPRRYIMAAPVLQVVTPSTVKDRFVFLFSDMIIFAKPIRAPPQETDAHALPTLAWTFSAKSILPLDEIKLTMPKNERRQNAAHTPLMATFVRQFTEDPRAALSALIEHSGLTNDPTTIAKLLHQTPDLDRQRLSDYLFGAREGAGQVMRAFVHQEKFTGVSIESALRSLMLELRFPPRREQIEDMLEYFAQEWVDTNQGLIKETFTPQLAAELLVATLSLNDALHSHHADTPGYFSRPNAALDKTTFVRAFRKSDPGCVLSDRTLHRIFHSVSADAVQQARLPRSKDIRERLTVRILTPGVPTRIMFDVKSEPIRIAIPRADPGLTIRLYGQNLSFYPGYLTFDKSHVQEFRVSSKSLGTHTIVFVRAGPHAHMYESVKSEIGEDYVLPRSINIAVQRAFMQHCFTLTHSDRRRFLVSVEDDAKRKLWLRAIKERLDATQRIVAKRAAANDSDRGEAQSLTLNVLKETLIQPDAPPVPMPLQRSASSAAGGGGGAAALQHAAVKLGLGRAPSDSRALQHPLHGIGAAAMGMQGGSNGIGNAVNRQESISKHYYGAKGPGHSERELLPNGGLNAKREQFTAPGRVGGPLGRGAPVVEALTGEDLILTVKQNSLLTLVIAHAQKEQREKQQQQQQGERPQREQPQRREQPQYREQQIQQQKQRQQQRQQEHVQQQQPQWQRQQQQQQHQRWEAM